MKKYFDGITKLDELRKAYKKWAMELDPWPMNTIE